MFRPKEINELRTAVTLLTPTHKTFNGVKSKSYPETGQTIFVNWKSKGGSEKIVNGVSVIEDTADVVTWWEPEITSDSLVKLSSGVKYEIINEPENVEQQNVFMTFKVRKYLGGSNGKT